MSDFKFNMSNVLLVCTIAIVTSTISEVLNWVLLYRKEDYKYNKSRERVYE